MEVGLSFLVLCLTPAIVFVCGGVIAATIEFLMESEGLVKTEQSNERGIS